MVSPRSIDDIVRDTDRDNFLGAEEAKTYGIVDEVVKSRRELPGPAAEPAKA